MRGEASEGLRFPAMARANCQISTDCWRHYCRLLTEIAARSSPTRTYAYVSKTELQL